MERTEHERDRERIAESIERVAKLMVRHMSTRQNLSLISSAVLSTLNAEGPVRLTTLATAEGVSQPSMTQLVQRLVRQGLATRVPDPEDGRATLVDISDAGRSLLSELRQARRGRLAALLETLPAEDEAALALAMHVALPIVERLIDNADRVIDQVTPPDPSPLP